MIHRGHAFSMAEGETKLSPSDYRFLQRFLDVTKANLFFARGVMIVEGDAESILLPALAKILGRDFTERGVSIANVGGIGLRRYARIFQRGDIKSDGELEVPVACLADMDVLPNCAPAIVGKVKDGEEWPTSRRWKAEKDFAPEELAARRKALDERASGQHVKTFVSDRWTLEYDLALGAQPDGGAVTGGLAEDVYVAACLANDDEKMNAGTLDRGAVEREARARFGKISESATAKDDSSREEVLASQIYASFAKDGVSKALAAQYLAESLERRLEEGQLTPDLLRSRLPTYLSRAIDYVTGVEAAAAPATEPADG